MKKTYTMQHEPNIHVASFGFDLGEAAKVSDPSEALSVLLTNIGTTFACDRVYIFEKNSEGSYDCTQEWTAREIMPKQHLMQNIQPNGVRFYYNYFHRGQSIIFQNIEDLKDNDPSLYKILKPQELTSVLCGQLLIDEQDIGFIGIDNPSPEKYGDLERIFEVIPFFVSSRIHRRNLDTKLRTRSTPAAAARPLLRSHSLYHRISLIKANEPLAIIYCDISMKFKEDRFDAAVMQKMTSYSETVLGSIFGPSNVFHVGNTEFLIFFEDTEDMDIESLDHYAAMAGKTFESMNMKVTMGYSSVRRYHEDFFDLVHKANIRMLRNKQKYRQQYIGKYHFSAASSFRDLVEIRPASGQYQVLYSEYPESCTKDGLIQNIMDRLSMMISPSDRRRFSEFWETQLSDVQDESKENSRRFDARSAGFSAVLDQKTISIEIHVVPYLDVHGEPVLMVYSI